MARGGCARRTSDGSPPRAGTCVSASQRRAAAAAALRGVRGERGERALIGAAAASTLRGGDLERRVRRHRGDAVLGGVGCAGGGEPVACAACAADTCCLSLKTSAANSAAVRLRTSFLAASSISRLVVTSPGPPAAAAFGTGGGGGGGSSHASGVPGGTCGADRTARVIRGLVEPLEAGRDRRGLAPPAARRSSRVDSICEQNVRYINVRYRLN